MKILVVDESDLSRSIVTAILGERGHAVATVASLAELPAALVREQPDLVLFDRLPGTRGGGLPMAAPPGGRKACPVVLLSDGSDAELARETAACGAAGYVRKRDAALLLCRHIERLVAAPR